jgi:hypothetical protein
VNATLSFTVPSDGNVDVVVECAIMISPGTVNGTVTLGLLDHTSGSQVGYSVTTYEALAFVGSSTQNALVRFCLTGLTPGANQVDLAAASSTATYNIPVQASTGVLGAGSAFPLIMEAFAA